MSAILISIGEIWRAQSSQAFTPVTCSGSSPKASAGSWSSLGIPADPGALDGLLDDGGKASANEGGGRATEACSWELACASSSPKRSSMGIFGT